MNKWLLVFAFPTIASIVLAVLLTMKVLSTGTRMADKTIFNADQHVVSYEQFRDNYQAYLRYVEQYCSGKQELQKLLKTGKVSEDDSYVRSLKISVDGYKKMALDVAQRYNSDAIKFYKKIWKGDLPERLPLNVVCSKY